MIVIKIIIMKLKTKEDAVMKFQMQADNLNCNLKVEIEFPLPGFSATKNLMLDIMWMNMLKIDMILY